MIKVQIKKSGETTDVTIKGDLIVQNAAELRNKLLELLQQFQHLRLNIHSVDRIDLAGLQLFCSARQTALKMNKLLEVEEIPPKITETVKSSGYAFRIGCRARDNSDCLCFNQEGS